MPSRIKPGDTFGRLTVVKAVFDKPKMRGDKI